MLMNYHQKNHYALLIKYTYLFGFKNSQDYIRKHCWKSVNIEQ